MLNSLKYFLIFLLVVASLGVRFYKIDNPLADWHSWRQADTAAVARNFEKIGFNPFLPRYDDLSNVQSGQENPEGYRLVEFPLYQTVGFMFYKALPFFSLEIWLRLVNIISSVFTGLILYNLVAKYFGKKEGWATLFIFSFLPYSVYYSRVILPEMFGVVLSLTAIFLMDKIYEQKNLTHKWYVVFFASALFAALAMLVKPTMFFLLIPLVFYFWQLRKKFINYRLIYWVVFALIVVLPLLTWRWWISHFPAGIPANEWLLNGGNIRFTGAFFRWLLAERLGKLMLGFGGLVFFFLGVVRQEIKPGGRLFWFFLLGIGLYAVIFARGNVQHDYYQIIWLPGVVIYTGIGMVALFSYAKSFLSWLKIVLVAVLCFFMMLAFSWYEIKGYYWVNHPEIIEAGKRVDVLTPKNAKVIAPYVGDTAFLYQTNRQGWPVVNRPIPEMIKQGAQFLVIVNPDEGALNLEKDYKILEKGNKYIIFDLRNPS